MRPRFVAALLFAVGIISAWPLASSRALADPVPGLSLKIESLDGKSTDARESRLAALCVPHDTPPTPFVARGPFRATFTGFLNLKLRDQYSFTAEGRGDLEVTVNSQVVLKCSGEDWSSQHGDLVKLKKGANDIIIRYTAPVAGDARMRLLWAEKSKLPDPVSPVVFTHEVDSALAEKLALHQGRELVATLRCLRCHTPAANLAAAAAGSMPELSIDAPALADVGSRLNAPWMARWISDPRSMRANATMPRLFAGEETSGGKTSAETRDIAAYLATRTATAVSSDAIDQSEANIAAGTRLFTSLGCIACHTTPAAADDPERTPLRFIKAKFKPAALVEFLKAPEAHYAWTRMPDFRLSEDEATDLAAFLLSNAPNDAFPAIDLGTADAKRGEASFASAGCVNCHEPARLPGMHAKPQAELTSADLSKGCLADDGGARGTAPDFGLDDSQRAAIRAFAKTDWNSLSREALPEFAERSIHALNCTACHRRDAQDDAWTKLAPEITALEQNLPPQAGPSADQQRPVLTWVGEKLHPDWMGNFIAGKVDYKPRPWLVARMPGFASRAALIAQGLCLEHGMSLSESPEPPVDTNLATIGRGLVGRANGFSCNQCHAVNQSPALVPFDSPAPNLMYVDERLRKDFYHEWVRNPQNYQPGTRMPTYADLDGKTAYKNILDGDAHQQFEAIWQYLRTGRKISPPE